MKRIFLFVVLMLSISTIVHAHKEWVHQYLVQQSYLYLEDQLGFELTDFKNHIGFNFYGPGPNDQPWSTGFIGVGAWREDLEDVIGDMEDFLMGGILQVLIFGKQTMVMM